MTEAPMQKTPVLCIAGPTATGKSALAIQLAEDHIRRHPTWVDDLAKYWATQAAPL